MAFVNDKVVDEMTSVNLESIQNSLAPTILSVSPTVGLWRHSKLESAVIQHLSYQGFQVVAISCDGMAITRCNYIDLIERYEKKDARAIACRECLSRNQIRESIHKSQGVTFSRLGEVKGLSRWLEKESIDDPQNILWNNLPAGRFACYELALNLKCEPENVPILAKEKYEETLAASITVLEKIKEICAEKKVSAAIFHNGLSAINRLSWEWCKSQGIKTIDIMNVSHKNYRDSKYYLNTDLWPLFSHSKSGLWDKVKEVNLNLQEDSFVESYLDSELIQGGIKNYGSGRSTGNATNKTEESNEFVALFLFNSTDERKTARYMLINSETIVESALDHLKLAKQIAASNPMVKFIFRIHPRMGKFHDSNESPQLREIIEYLSDSTSNVKVVFPERQISLQESLQSSDIVLSFGTTAGLLASAAGLPVVLCSRDNDWTFPKDIYFVPKDFTELEITKLISVVLSNNFDRGEIERRKNYARRAINFLHNWLSLEFEQKKLGKSEKLFLMFRSKIWYKFGRTKAIDFDGYVVRSRLKYFKIALHTLFNLQVEPPKSRVSVVWRHLIDKDEATVEDLLVNTYLQDRLRN